jgi:GTP cyclohydrolase I
VADDGKNATAAEEFTRADGAAVDLPRAARAIDDFLRAIGAPVDHDPELAGTGRRVADAFALDLLSGYRDDPSKILAEATASRSRGLVVVTDLAASTLCPHHLLPAMGRVHVGYLPGERVVGLGALGRLVDCFSRRLSLQEDIGQQIADALVRELGARAAGVAIDFVQACVAARGERRQGAHAYTLAFAGSYLDDVALRGELVHMFPPAGAGAGSSAGAAAGACDCVRSAASSARSAASTK